MVALDRHEVIAALFKENLLTGFYLSMQGITQHDLAPQIQAAEHLAGRRNLVALGLGDHSAQILALAVGRIDHFHAAVTHLLAVNNNQGVLDRASQSPLPTQEHPLQHWARSSGPWRTPVAIAMVIKLTIPARG